MSITALYSKFPVLTLQQDSFNKSFAPPFKTLSHKEQGLGLHPARAQCSRHVLITPALFKLEKRASTLMNLVEKCGCTWGVLHSVRILLKPIV